MGYKLPPEGQFVSHIIDTAGVGRRSYASRGYSGLRVAHAFVTVLGLVAAGDPAFRVDAVDAVASQVPLIGHELTGNVHQLQRSSVIGLIVGLATLVWGTTGLAQAGLFTMEQVWNLPGPARPGFLPRLVRSLLFLVLLGLVVIATSLLAGLSTYGQHALAFVMFAEAVEATVNAGMYFVGFRILTPRGVPSRDLAPGAVTAGIGWTALQVAGAYLIHHLPAQRLRLRCVRDRARAGGLAVPRGPDHRLLRGDQRGPFPPAVAEVDHPAAADRGGPGQPGAAGTVESAAQGAAGRRHVHRPRAGRAGGADDTADSRRDLPARPAHTATAGAIRHPGSAGTVPGRTVRWDFPGA